MSIEHVKRATFLCPSVLTGGPEAIHQVAQTFNEEGLPADIAYYGPGSNLDVTAGRLTARAPTQNPCLDAYAHYNPVPSAGALLRRHHLVVVPEVMALNARLFRPATVAVWWLSVDNANLDVISRLKLFAAKELLHFAQSEYAADWLRQNGVRHVYALGDYTDSRFTALSPQCPNSRVAVAYNRAKGADLADTFFAAHPELEGTAIRGMVRGEVAELLTGTQVYVDFGHLPGKDRLPREAAASGAIVFLRRKGAGAYAGDFRVPDFFRFDEEDVRSGELALRLAAVQADPTPYFVQQEELRADIRHEQAELRAQVRSLRGLRRVA